MKRKWFARIAAIALALGVGAGAGIAISNGPALETQADGDVTDTLNLAFTGVDGSYTSWSGKKGSESNAVYAGNSHSGNSSIQMRSSSNSGIISTTSGGTLKSVAITWNANTLKDRVIDVYGSNTAYTATSNLYDNSAQGTKIGSFKKAEGSTASNPINVTSNYSYIGIRSNSGAVYVSEFRITWTPSADTITSLQASTNQTISPFEGDPIDLTAFTITGVKNGAASAELADTDFVFQGFGSGEGENFEALSTTKYMAGGDHLQWKAAYPTTGGGSEFAYATYNVTVGVSRAEYHKVTDWSTLAVGKKYLVVAEPDDKHTNALALSGIASGNIGSTTEVTINEGVISSRGVALEYQLGGDEDGYTLFSDGKFLALTSDGNYLYTATTKSPTTSKWTIDATNQLIYNAEYNTRVIGFNYNSGNARFACYMTTSSVLQHISLYERVALDPYLEINEPIVGVAGSVANLAVNPVNFTATPDYVITSSDSDIVSVGATNPFELSLNAVGTAVLTIRASHETELCVARIYVFVIDTPTGVTVKIGDDTMTTESVAEVYQDAFITTKTSVAPGTAEQLVSLSVQSCDVEGGITVSGKKINGVKECTGVVRFTAIGDPTGSVYFDLNVKVIANPYTEKTLAVSGDVASQQAGFGFDPTGLTFSITRASGNVSPKAAEFTFSPETLALTDTKVTALHTPSGQTIDIDITGKVVDNSIAISEFYDSESEHYATKTASSAAKVFKGTCVGIEGNSYYLQQDEYGILIYGGSVTPPAGLKVGDLVIVSSKIINYKEYVVENSGAAKVNIIGAGTLPAMASVQTVEEFEAHNQSTRLAFLGLAVQAEATSVAWTSSYAAGTSDGLATVRDVNGKTVDLFISRFLEETAANAIITKIATITAADTFDIVSSVKTINTGNGNARLSLFSEDSITIHVPAEDKVQTFINTYMHMDDPAFQGDGTGLCNSQGIYLTAKQALYTLGDEEILRFKNDEDGKYTAALARYLEWARICGDEKPFEGNTIVSTSRFAGVLRGGISPAWIAIAILGVTAVVGGSLYFFNKKRRAR